MAKQPVPGHLPEEGKDAFMETRYIPVEETEAQPTRKESDLSWTESEWFQTWLQLARQKYQQEPQHEAH